MGRSKLVPFARGLYRVNTVVVELRGLKKGNGRKGFDKNDSIKIREGRVERPPLNRLGGPSCPALASRGLAGRFCHR